MSRTEFVKEVQERLGPVLSNTGFVRSRLRWVRVREPFIDCVDLQTRSDNAACCVNLGEHHSFLPIAGGATPMDIKKMSSAHCEITSRLAPAGETDHWWEFEDPSAVEGLLVCFEKTGETFFRQYDDFPRPFVDIKISEIESRSAVDLMPMMTTVRRILLLARLYDYLGDSPNAIGWAEFGMQKAGRMAVGPKVAFREILRKHQSGEGRRT